jgi:hypothetical protein
MQRVGALPPGVRREGEHAEQAAQPVIGPARVEERAVAAIVLEHEQSQKQRGRRYREQERCPNLVMDADEHGSEQRQERQAGVEQLDHAAAGIGLGVAGNDLAPRGRRGQIAGPGRRAGFGAIDHEQETISRMPGATLARSQSRREQLRR